MAKKKTARRPAAAAGTSPAESTGAAQPAARKTTKKKASKKKASRKKTVSKKKPAGVTKKKASKKKATRKKATKKKAAKKTATRKKATKKKAARKKVASSHSAPAAVSTVEPETPTTAVETTSQASLESIAALETLGNEKAESTTPATTEPETREDQPVDADGSSNIEVIVLDPPNDEGVTSFDSDEQVQGLDGLDWFDEADAVIVDLSADPVEEDPIAVTRSAAETGEALLAAAERGDSDLVRTLLQMHASPTARDRRRGTIGWTPLMLATASGHTDVVAQLLAAGADRQATDDVDGRYAARVASLARTMTADQIAGEGMPLGRSVMHIATAYGRPSIARMLADGGCPVDVPDHSGETPLMLAAQSGAHDIAQLLIERGADLDARDNRSGCGAIERAAMLGRAPMIERLLSAGATISSRDLEGRTPLMYAVGGAHYDAARVLLENRADPCAQAESGFGVLCAAVCARGYFPEPDGTFAVRPFPEESILPVVELLLRWGAVDVPDGTGVRPSQHSEGLGHVSVVRILHEYSGEEYRRTG
ncbi:MAG: ankyrin repeat domain-containing protein [Planctomycetota bacterium]